MTDFWTVERVETLRRLYAERYSFSEIAAAIGGISRNAAIGKAHRLGLYGKKVLARPKPEPAPKRPPTPGISAAVQKINMAKAAPAPKVKPEPFVVAAADVEPLNVTFEDLEPHHCRFAYGNQPPFLFCGHPNADGSSYCGAHHRLCIVPVPQRRGGPHDAELGRHRGGVFGRTA